MAGRRISVASAGPFVVAAALVGGPLLGACVGAAIQLIAGTAPRRRRAAYATAAALQGFVVGVVGEQLSQRGSSGAVLAATAGLLIGCLLSVAASLLVAGSQGSWREILVTWFLPAPLLVAFLYLFQTSPPLALAYAAGLLLVA